LKVLHIITGLSIGGAEKALFNILNNGLNESHQNHVITMIPGGELENPIRNIGVPVISLGLRKGAISLSSIINLKKHVRNIRPDIIQGWMYHGNLASSISRSFTSNSASLVWNIRTCLYSLKDQKYMTRWVIRANRKLSNIPKSIIYNSLLSRDQHEDFGFSSNTGIVIPNGIDLNAFYPDPTLKHLIREELQIPRSAIVIGHVARFHAVKDHANFMQAAAKLVEKNQHVYILMLGDQITTDNTQLKPNITEPLSRNIRMLGKQSDVAKYMKAMDYFCISSAWGEAFPNVIGEAMATGIPCISTDVGDCSSIIANTGIIVPPKNSSELLNAMQYMLTLTENGQVSLSTAARQRIINNYSIDSIASKYSDLYSRLAI